ncbi:hypothetical protein HK096_004418 [Nowakowskiella sp. JEL0078]|nr:hypothetical protein HK096_004418 [Nowakowskiella sp. JEL0078]
MDKISSYAILLNARRIQVVILFSSIPQTSQTKVTIQADKSAEFFKNKSKQPNIFPSKEQKQPNIFPSKEQNSKNRLYVFGFGFALSAFTLFVAMQTSYTEASTNVEDKLRKGDSEVSYSIVPLEIVNQIPNARAMPKVWLFGGGLKPISIKQFDGMIFRDLKITNNCLTAIDEKGNLFVIPTSALSNQSDTFSPLVEGLDLKSVTQLNDTLYALSKSGNVFTIPVDLPQPIIVPRTLWGKQIFSEIGVLKIPKNERIVSLCSGKLHLLLLTSKGNILSTPISVPNSKPPDLSTINLEKLDLPQIHQIACGNNHSIAVTKDGKVFSWGSNNFGQCSISTNAKIADTLGSADVWVPRPREIEFKNVVGIGAGPDSSFVLTESKNSNFEIFGCGIGQFGQLGNGIFKHTQHYFMKLPLLSNKMQFHEPSNSIIPISVRSISCGNLHCAAVLNSSTSASDGDDVLVWGANNLAQLNRADRKSTASAKPTWAASFENYQINSELREYNISDLSESNSSSRLQVAPKGEVKGRKMAIQNVHCGGDYTVVYFTQNL